MNQEKIGLFIAGCRKRKGYTQLQLAEKLGVTDRSISNWENGKCMPDLSLFKPLCEILEISINELLSGERIEEDNLKIKTDESAIKLVDISSQEIKKARKKLFFVSLSFLTIILFFVVDFLCIFIFHRPLFAVRGSLPYMYKGLLYDTYNCPQYSVPQIKLKGSKFSCVECIDVSESDVYSCSNDSELYYEENGRFVFTYCLDNITFKYKDKKIDLLEFIRENGSLEKAIDQLTLNENASLWDEVGIYKDGGTTKYSNRDLTLIKCNRMLDDRSINQDIYFGPSDMEFNSSYCTNDNRRFIRTYRLENIKQADEEYSYYLTLSLFQGNTDTVLVHDIFNELEVGKNYEFKFTKIPITLNVSDKIDEIFENTELISIQETDKLGLGQIQEKMY